MAARHVEIVEAAVWVARYAFNVSMYKGIDAQKALRVRARRGMPDNIRRDIERLRKYLPVLEKHFPTLSDQGLIDLAYAVASAASAKLQGIITNGKKGEGSPEDRLLLAANELGRARTLELLGAVEKRPPPPPPPPPPKVDYVALERQIKVVVAKFVDGLMREVSDATLSELAALVPGPSVEKTPRSSPRREKPREVRLNLTPPESEVLGHLSSGLSSKEIAQKLGVSDYRVKLHVHSLLQKQRRRRYALGLPG